jgi:protein-S-isoprenylcysteine O-methyltransferase Ste14
VPNRSSRLRGLLAALAVSASCLVAVWLWAVPSVFSPWTFAFITIIVSAGAIVSLLTWRNAQATSTVGQLLQATEAAAAPGPFRAETTRTRSK